MIKDNEKTSKIKIEKKKKKNIWNVFCYLCFRNIEHVLEMKKKDDELSIYLKQMRKASQKAKKSADEIPPAKSVLVNEMKSVTNFLSKEIPKDFFDNQKEWIEKFKVWFSYVRNMMQNNTEKHEKTEFNQIIKLIESGISPKPCDISDDNSLKVFCYFSKRNGTLSHTDCIWIFSYLSVINMLETKTPDGSSHLQELSHLVYSNLQNVKKEEQIYSYLAIILIIIQKYFNQ